MGKRFVQALGFVAAVAIPFVAPVIASSIGLSAAIGATAGSAVVGGVMGAGAASLTGGDTGRGALLGAIGGGIGGYTSTPAAPTTSPYSLAAATPTAPAAGLTPGAVDYSLAAGTQMPTLGLSPTVAGTGVGLQMPDVGLLSTGTGAAMAAGTPIDYSLAAGLPSSTGLSVASMAPTGGTTLVTPAGTFASTSPIETYAGGSFGGTAAAAPSAAGVSTAGTAGTAAQAAAGGAPKTFTEALKARLTSPEGLADMTLRAAGMLAGSAIAGEGISAEERALLNEQVNELRQLQQTNRALFEQRLEQAQNVIGESKYFDPEYFGLQRARRIQMAGAKAKRAGLRGLTGEARETEGRRFDLATAREVGTAFDQGYLTGVQGRLGTMQAGLQMMPSGFPSSMGDYTNLRGAYTAAANRARQTQSDIGSLFGSLIPTRPRG